MAIGRLWTQRLAATALSASFCTGMAAAPAWSDVLVTDLDEPVSVILQTPLDVTRDEAGKKYEAVFDDDYTYLTGMIPQGTRIYGTVEKLRESKRFGRPGYFRLSVDKITFPDGTPCPLSKEELDELDQKVHHPDAQTKKRIFKSNMASTIAGSTTSVTLHAVGVFAFPYAVGARVLAGAVYEGVAGDKEQPLTKRLGKGAYKGTGIPGAIHFVKKSPNPVYEPGDAIALRMDPEALAELFAATPNPDADWYMADFSQYDWEDHDRLTFYMNMAEQLNRDPDEKFQALILDLRQQKGITFSDFVKTPVLHSSDSVPPESQQFIVPAGEPEGSKAQLPDASLD